MRFADTSFWVALQIPADNHHDDASALWSADDIPIISTNHIVGETWTFTRRRLDHRRAVRLLDLIERSRRVQVVRVEDALEEEAWRWLRRHDERSYSFVDATSFAVMRRRRIRDALAFDGDFAAAGFVELRP
ncbi:MAG: PIN domain-containing protein [Actinomycetota bacterium]